MPPQARIGDPSQVPADAHGCPACPHTALGPAVQGSKNVLVNSLPAVRIGDQGIHAACCGPNTWNAKTGSRSVLINGRKAHRKGDLVSHCGGSGHTIAGSPNVIVGDMSQGATHNEETQAHDVTFVVHYEGTQQPIPNVRYRITLAKGQILEGQTDGHGMTQMVNTEHAELVKIEILGSEE